jgi:hypothetical protein
VHSGEEAEGGAGEAGQAFVGVNWVMEDKEIDVETELALGFLDYLMLVRVVKAYLSIPWFLLMTKGRAGPGPLPHAGVFLGING